MSKIIREVKNSSDDFDNLLRYNRDVIFDSNEKQETFEDGVEQNKIDVAKVMFQENCNVDLICRVTKLSLKQVQKLKEEFK